MKSNLTWHDQTISLQEREERQNHKSACIWLTGLSGSGKSTLANGLQKKLFDLKCSVYVLDGDNIRHGLNSDLGFSSEHREENIRRVGEVAKLFVDAGFIVITAFISPFIKDRDLVRTIMPENRFVEIFVDCDLDTCESRDPKGLYKKAREGQIEDFTGITSGYEAPQNPELIVDNSGACTIDENVSAIIEYLRNKKILR